MEEIMARLDDIEVKMTGLEIKLDALLYALMEDEEEVDGDKHGRNRGDDQVL